MVKGGSLQDRTVQLELLSALPQRSNRGVSVLLIHGICLGAWVWRDNFLPYFAERGLPTYALSLRGHGDSDGGDRTGAWRLRDFSDDLDWAVRKIGGDVVIVAHSMGGGVAQYYLRQGRRAAGVVLMASVPPHGLLRASLSMYSRNPTLWDELYQARNGDLRDFGLGMIERSLFSEPIAPVERQRLLRCLGAPAIQASLELMGWPPIAPFPWGLPPMMIIGAEKDDLVPLTDVFLSGAYYGVGPEIIAGGAHAIMLEPHWRQAADMICAWLMRRFGA